MLLEFADQLKQARNFGSLTQFGRGLPKGGEQVVARSLEFQEKIVRAMTDQEKSDLSLVSDNKKSIYCHFCLRCNFSSLESAQFGPDERARVAKECGCRIEDVNSVITKYNWFKEAAKKVAERKREGKPMPKTLTEVRSVINESLWNIYVFFPFNVRYIFCERLKK